MIHFTTVRIAGAITALAITVLTIAGCGVRSQDTPRPVDETPIQPPPATSGVDTAPSSPETVTTSSTPSPTSSPNG